MQRVNGGHRSANVSMHAATDPHCFRYIFICLLYLRLSGKNIAVEVTPRDVTSATAVLMPSLHTHPSTSAPRMHDVSVYLSFSRFRSLRSEESRAAPDSVLVQGVRWTNHSAHFVTDAV